MLGQRKPLAGRVGLWGGVWSVAREHTAEVLGAAVGEGCPVPDSSIQLLSRCQSRPLGTTARGSASPVWSLCMKASNPYLTLPSSVFKMIAGFIIFMLSIFKKSIVIYFIFTEK